MPRRDDACIRAAGPERAGRLVIACHQHSLRGVEIYQGKPIFYGLGAFVTDLPNIEDRLPAVMLQKWRAGKDPYVIGVRPGYPTFPFHPDYRLTMMARVAFKGREVSRVGVIPCEIEPDGHPAPPTPAATSPAAPSAVGFSSSNSSRSFA